ncbi:MAG: hypothetical protein ACM34K_08270 [Bacillota bacterium]
MQQMQQQKPSWQQSSSDIPPPLSEVFSAYILPDIMSSLSVSEQADPSEERVTKKIINNFM